MTTGEYYVLRRFDPNNQFHVVINEGAGTFRITSGAFSFDESEGHPNNLELSVYNSMQLNLQGFRDTSILINQREGLDICRCLSSAVGQVFHGDHPALSLVKDPDPYGPEMSAEIDFAHELILLSSEYSRKVRQRIISDLASKFSSPNATASTE